MRVRQLWAHLKPSSSVGACLSWPPGWRTDVTTSRLQVAISMEYCDQVSWDAWSRGVSFANMG